MLLNQTRKRKIKCDITIKKQILVMKCSVLERKENENERTE